MEEDIDFHGELERITRAEPFVPFVIVTTSGARHEVRNRDDALYVGDLVSVTRKRSSILIRVYSIEAIELSEIDD